MACSIIKNKSGVQSVLAPNGVESNLYQDLLKLPFIEGQNDALIYHNKAQQYAKDSFHTDENGEPIVMFRARSSMDQFGLGNKLVYTTSFAEALKNDREGKGVEVGFVKKRKNTNVLDKSLNVFDFIKNTRSGARGLGINQQLVSELAGGQSVVVTSSQNDFTPLTLFNKEGDSATASGFATMAMTSGFVAKEKVNLSELLNEEPVSEGSQSTAVQMESVDGNPSGVNVVVNGNNVATVELEPMLDGFEVPRLDLSNPSFPQSVAQDMLKLAFAQTKKPIYSARNLSPQELEVWETLEREQVAKKMPDGRYVLDSMSAKKRASKNQDISVAELKQDGTIQVKFNTLDPHYVYKGQTYRSKGALNKAVKLDLRRGNVSSTTSNNSFVYEMTDPIFQGVMEGLAQEMFDTHDFLTFFEQNGKTYMMLDENQANQVFSDVKIFNSPQGEVEIDVRKEFEKAKRGRNIQDVQGLALEVENMLLREMQDTAMDNAKTLLKTSESARMQKLRNFLSNLGVNVVSMEEYQRNYEQRFGRPVGVNGIADMVNRVIVLSNEADTSVLTEEVAHFAVEFFQDQATVNRMLDVIDTTNAYKTYADSYREAYSKKIQGEKGLEGAALERKVRQEILGKILAEKIEDNFNTENAANVAEEGIFSTLLDLFNKFLDLFLRTNKNSQFFREYESTIDFMAKEVVDPSSSQAFLPRESTEFYFNLNEGKPASQSLSNNLVMAMRPYRDKYLRLMGLEEKGTEKSAAMHDTVQKATEGRLLESTNQFLGVMRSDVRRAAEILRNAENQVLRKLRDEQGGNPRADMSSNQMAQELLLNIPNPNIMNLITYMSSINEDLEAISAFLTDLKASGLYSTEDIKSLEDVIAEIKRQSELIRPQVNELIQAKVQNDFVELARQRGASDEMIQQIKNRMLSSAGMTDMTMVAQYLFSGSDMISNPIFAYGYMAMREQENVAIRRRENYFNNFLDKLEEFNMFGREEEFFKKAVNGSYWRAPIDIQSFQKDFNDAISEVRMKYAEQINALDRTKDADRIKIEELKVLAEEEETAIRDKFLMSRFIEKPDSRRTNRETENPVTGLKTRTEEARRKIRAYSRAKANVYSRYRDPDTGEFVNTFDSKDLAALDTIKKQIKHASSLYDEAYRPKTGLELATALDIRDYYESFQGGELSEEASDAYYVARERAKAQFGASSRNFKAWEKVFSIEVYPENSVETNAEPLQIDEEALRDAMGNRYKARIAAITKMVNTENVSPEEVTPTFLYEGLKEKKKSLLDAFRSNRLNNEVDGVEFSKDLMAVQELRSINKALAELTGPKSKNTPRGEYVVDNERKSPFTFQAVPNQSFKAEYIRLENMQKETGGTQLSDWLDTLNLTGRTDGKFPIPRDAQYVAYKKYENGQLVQKEKRPSFIWESMTNQALEENPDFNADLVGKFHQPSAEMMEKYKDKEYYKTFGIKESVNPWSEVATKNKDIFGMLTFYQESKFNVDRFQGLNNHYYLRPQVRTSPNERLFQAFTDPSSIRGNINTWFKETFVIDETDEEFGDRAVKNKDGSVTQVKGSRAIPRYFHIEKPSNELTRDIAYSMGRYMDSGFRYMGRSKALMKAQMALYALEQSNYSQMGTGKLKQKGASNYAETLRMMIDRDIFGNLTESKFLNTTLGNSQINVAKTIRAYNTYTKSLLMAANPYVPATSYFASRLQTRAIGREGKLYTEKSRRRARAKYDLNGASAKSIFDENTGQFIPGNRATLLIQHTGLKRDIEEMFMGSTLSRGRRAARRFKPGNITGFQIANQLQAIEAVTSAFDNFRLYDGTFLTHVRFVEKMMEDTNMTRAQIEKVWDKLGDKTYDSFLVKQGNRLVLDREALDAEGFNLSRIDDLESQAKELAKTAKSKIDANLEGSQAALIQRTPELAIFFPFKNYLSVLIGSRFKKAGYDPVLGIYDEGVYNTVFGGTRIADIPRALLSAFASAAHFSAAGNSVLSMLDNTDLSEAQKRNWMRLGADIRMFVIAAAAMYLLNMMAYGADGEEDDSFMTQYASYIATRVFYETLSSTIFGTPYLPEELVGPGAALGRAKQLFQSITKIGLDPADLEKDAGKDKRSAAEKKADKGILSVLGIENPGEYVGMAGETFDNYVPIYYNLHRLLEAKDRPLAIRETESNYIRYKESVIGKYLYKLSKLKGKESARREAIF